MTNKEIIKQLRGFTNLTPDKNWRKRQRHHLLSKIDNVDLAATNRQFFIWRWRQHFQIKEFALGLTQRLLKPVPVTFILVAFFSLMGGSVLGIIAAKASPYQEPFYSVKTLLENIQTTLSFSETTKARVKLSHVENRIRELQAVVKEKEKDPQEVANKALQVVNRLQADAVQVKVHLTSLQVKGKIEAVKEIADIVDERASDFTAALSEASEQATDEVKDEIEVASNTLEETSLTALSALVAKYQNESDNMILRQSSDLAKRLSKRINEIKDKIKLLKLIDGETLVKAEADLAAAQEFLQTEDFDQALSKVLLAHQRVKSLILGTNNLGAEESGQNENWQSTVKGISATFKQETSTAEFIFSTSTPDIGSATPTKQIEKQKVDSPSSTESLISEEEKVYSTTSTLDYNFEDRLKEFKVFIGE